MWRVLIVAVLAVCWSIPALACDCSSPTAQIPVKSAQLAAWGEVETVAKSASGHLARFRIHELLHDEKDKRPRQIVLQDPTYCGVDFKEGETYFIRGLEMRTEGVYLTNSCAGSRPIATPPHIVEGTKMELVRAESTQQGALERAATEAARSCREQERGRIFQPFVLTVAPDDDPLVVDRKTALQQKNATDCVGQLMLDNVAKVNADQPLVVSGSALFGDRARAVVDVWVCKSGKQCDTYSKRMTERLLDVAAPLTEQQARILAKQMHNVTDRDPSIEIARTLCRLDGVEAAEKFARNNKLVGGPRWDAELQVMLFECSVATRKFDEARMLLQTTNPGPAFSTAFEWARKAEDMTLPIRKDGPTLDQTLDEPSLLAVRQSFAETELWENDPMMLEAFAESVAADPRAPGEVRKLGALAYQKAALLQPAAAEQYLKFARELAADDELGDSLTQLRSKFQDAMKANEARTSLAERTAAEEVEQLDLEAPQTNQANTRRAPILKDDPKDDGLDLDWGSLALHLLVIVGSLSVVAFLASRGSRRR